MRITPLIWCAGRIAREYSVLRPVSNVEQETIICRSTRGQMMTTELQGDETKVELEHAALISQHVCCDQIVYNSPQLRVEPCWTLLA